MWRKHIEAAGARHVGDNRIGGRERPSDLNNRAIGNREEHEIDRVEPKLQGLDRCGIARLGNDFVAMVKDSSLVSVLGPSGKAPLTSDRAATSWVAQPALPIAP